MAGMVDRLVLVNGLPGSGKTTLATQLAARLAVPLVSQDAVKELLADAFPAVPMASLGAIAADTAWSLVAETPGTVILDSWFFRPRDLPFVKAGLERCCAAMVVEIWCDVPPGIARHRHESRIRHAVHRDHRATESWSDRAAAADPLDIGLTFRIPTDQPVDIDALATGLRDVADGYDF
jgi:predicted kinase